jgi:putative tricarboxylic transport membrane protein
MLQMFETGFAQIASFEVISWIVVGVIMGIIFGGTPGISTSMGIALMLPITFRMPLILSVATILGLYIGGTSGGLITAILLNIPGTSASIATTWDGHPMARNGEAGKALGIGILYSFIGGMLSLIILFVMAPALARIALKFSAIEYLAISIFSLTLITSVSGKSLAKGLVSATLGVIFTTFGAAPVDGVLRFTFGYHGLDAGFQLLPVLVGIYAVAEILKVAEKNIPLPAIHDYKMHGFGISWKEFWGQFVNMVRSTLIGTGVGILPGIGGGVSNIVAYTAAKNQSRYPEKFGTGVIDGIVASETANNAVTGGALIPLLTLGIPGDAGTAMLLAALMVQGVIPGPMLFRTNIRLIYAIFAIMITANLIMLVVEFFGLPLFLKVLVVPKHILFPVVLAMCAVGAYASNNRVFDVWSIIIFAVVGYGMSKFRYPVSPFILGYILGSIFELNLRRALMITRGNYLAFFSKPIAAGAFIVTALFLAFILVRRYRAKEDTFVEES